MRSEILDLGPRTRIMYPYVNITNALKKTKYHKREQTII